MTAQSSHDRQLYAQRHLESAKYLHGKHITNLTMPILCNMHSNLPQPDMSLKTNSIQHNSGILGLHAARTRLRFFTDQADVYGLAMFVSACLKCCDLAVIPPYLFPRKISKRYRLTSSRPDAILITPYEAKSTPSSPSTSCSHHHALHSRHNPTLWTTTAKCVRQPHQLNVNQRHVHLIEIKTCEDTRPGQ
eukprot:1153551-Pelagomonas_calceolata.AAC.1